MPEIFDFLKDNAHGADTGGKNITLARQGEQLLAAPKFVARKTPSQENFNPDDTIARLHFPDSISPKAAAWLLDHVNAIAVAPTNSPAYDPDEISKGYNFVVRSNEFNELINKPITPEAVLQDDMATQFFMDMINDSQKIRAVKSDPKTSKFFWETRQYLIKFTEHSFDTTDNIRDYVNFLYSWASDNIRNQEMTKEQQKAEDIFKEYLFLLIKKVELAKSESEKRKLIKHIIASVIFDDTGMSYKINQFNGNIGKLKATTPPSMAVILDNGAHADFFKLDSNKYYKFMNYIDVSKTKMPFDFSNIEINSDFVCSGARAKIVFPKRINGFIDCSNTDIKLLGLDKIPNGTTYIDFSGTVKKFADLLNIKFPKSVCEIRLSRSVLNAVAKDASMLDEFRQFQNKNPNIEIWDSKHALSLQNILTSALNQIEQKRAVKPVASSVAATQKANTTTKTEQWLSRKEIVELCRVDAQFNEISVDEKLVKYAIKTNNQIKSCTKTCDGQSVVCVHVDSVDLLKQTMLQLYQENVVSKTPKVTTQPTKTKAQKTEVKVKKVKQTIKIEKYIPKQIWKSICNACGDSLNLLYSVLERIDKVNINYATLTPHTPLQYFDKNNTKKIIPNTEVKSGCAASQHIENNDNRRIVWTINPDDKIMVAIAFFADHVNNVQSMKMYNSVAIPNATKGQNIDGVTVNNDFVERSDYLKVSELLQTYSKKIEERKKQVPSEAPAPTRAKRPRIARTTSQQAVTSQPAQQPVATARHATLVDVKSLDVQIENFIKHLDIEIKRLANDIVRNADDAKRQLRNVEEMKKLLQEKISLQKEL
ncbi:MAG: hypothetical protein ACLRFM_02965 [Alphaproteobacteria bacterium]